MNVERALSLILREASAAEREGDAHDYNFPVRSLQAMREAERAFGRQLIWPISERLEDAGTDGVGARVLLGALVHLVPSRQRVFETTLSNMLPGWRKKLSANPQESLPEEFHAASEVAKAAAIDFPTTVTRALLKAARSTHPDVVRAALRGIQTVGDQRCLDTCLDLAAHAQPAVKSAALLTVGRLQAAAPNRSSEVTHTCKTVAFDRGSPPAQRLAAFEGMFSLSTRAHADHFSAALADDSLGLTADELFLAFALDLARPTYAEPIARIVGSLGIDTLADPTLRRIARAGWLPMTFRAAAAERVSRSLSRLDAMIDDSTRVGLLVQRNSAATGLFVGHCGIFVSEDAVIHCTTDSDPLAVHELSFDNWRHDLECWGIRRDTNLPEGGRATAIARAREIASWRTEYDGNHLNQKGEWFKGWFCSARYWEADCVGFTERVCEDAGGNPTPNEFESGAGWPLTPREQRDAMQLVFPC